MAQIRLKTKLVLAISGMVFALIAVFSYFYVSRMVRQRFTNAYDNAAFVAKEIRESAREASQIDLSSTFINTNDPKQVEAVLDEALQTDPGLNTLLQSIVGYSPTIADAAITDVSGRAIVHTDPSAIGTQLEPREDFQNVRNGSFRRQLDVVYGAPRVYEVYLPIQREGQPFGDIRVGISTVLLKSEVQPELTSALLFSAFAILLSLALAAGVSNIALRPLEATQPAILGGQFPRCLMHTLHTHRAPPRLPRTLPKTYNPVSAFQDSERGGSMWIRKGQRDRLKGVDSPVPTQLVSNEEYIPRRQTQKQKEVEYWTGQIADEKSRKLGMDRRKFMATPMGLAACFLASNKVWGKVWDVGEDEAADQGAYEEKLPKGEYFVLDVQSHFTNGMPIGFCGEIGKMEFFQNMGFKLKEDKEAYSFHNFIKEMFFDSETDMIVISGVPGKEQQRDKDGKVLEGQARTPGLNILPSWLMAQARDEINGLAQSKRALSQGNLAPNHYWDKVANKPDKAATIEQMEIGRA